MLINNIDISTFGAVLSDKQIQNCNININSNWNPQALQYVVTSKYVQYKNIKITVNFIADTEQEVLNNISSFYNLLKDKCTIKFDDIDFCYDCIYVTQGSSNTGGDITKQSNNNYEAVINLTGYAYKQEAPQTFTQNGTVNAEGNNQSPAVVTVTVPIDTVSLTIEGLSSDNIIIKNLKANVPVVIDGEACTVLESGSNKFGDTDMWEFPVLQPGVNNISSDNSKAVIQIEYKSRWM